MKFDVEKFYDFCSQLTIDSRERGQIKLTRENLLGTQKFFVEEISKGLNEGIHTFVILKGRQEGVTTISAALDLYWVMYHPGMQASFASHNEEARDGFRAMMTMYHGGLPKTHRVGVVQNNRNFISFKNRSMIKMQIGGSGSNSGKGRGAAITFLHATECGSWNDEEALASMKASCSQKNPNRLQIYESTANGFNLFHKMWKTAKMATAQKAVFIGWWLNKFYRKEKNSNEYRVYWDGELTREEREWVRQVKLYYGYEIQPEQIAWWRWFSAEEIDDPEMMMQEFPPHEHVAFVLSGKNFFSVKILEEEETRIISEPEPDYFRLSFGEEFIDTTSERCSATMADLTVWEHPEADGFYTIGADPAYGSSDWADRFVIQVMRCYADRVEQVCEYAVTDLTAYKFAWVLCYLAGAYKNSMINLEINGPGEQVFSEMEALRRRAGQLGRASVGMGGLADVAGGLKYYLYRRLDSPGGGGGAFHFKTTAGTKEKILNGMRDLLYRGRLIIHSAELVDEMKTTVREEGGFIGGSGRDKDDRVIATALATEQYDRYIRGKLELVGLTWASEQLKRKQREINDSPLGAAQSTMNRSLADYLKKVGIKGAA